MTHILLTNDDGIHAAGLKALAAGLEGFATISIVAPNREQSGAALHHIPALAVSLCSKGADVKFDTAARVARSTAELILKEGLPDQVLLNVNVPEPWSGEV